MKLKIPAGKYILAVSGGVDSMVLLDLLTKKSDVHIIVAHFNHGIRLDSTEDQQLVATTAERYDLEFEAGVASLGPTASEAEARAARYDFLKSIKSKYQADAIITAHHQDDFIETAFINILRGTGPRGLIAMSSNEAVLRPLMNITKKRIINYAQKNKIIWREDTTNKDEKYLRNYLRQRIIPKLSLEQKKELISNFDQIAINSLLKNQILAQLEDYLLSEQGLSRSRLSSLSSDIANEFLIHWLRKSGFYDYDQKAINKLAAFIKTGQPGSRFDIDKHLDAVLSKKSVLLETKAR